MFSATATPVGKAKGPSREQVAGEASATTPRTVECTPSAPITTSASTRVPSGKVSSADGGDVSTQFVVGCGKATRSSGIATVAGPWEGHELVERLDTPNQDS